MATNQELIRQVGRKKLAELLDLPDLLNKDVMEVEVPCPLKSHKDPSVPAYWNPDTGIGSCSWHDVPETFGLREVAAKALGVSVLEANKKLNALLKSKDRVVDLADSEVVKGRSMYRSMPDNLLPGEGFGFLGEFVKYGRQVTDANLEYIFWSGIMALAGAIGNSRWIPNINGKPLYLNLFLAIVGQSSTARKSTCLGLATDLCDFPPDEDSYDFDILYGDKSTPEAFFKRLANQPSGLWAQGELGAFLKSFERSYMQGFLEDITHWYDVPARVKKTKLVEGKDRDTCIERPCISLFAATTPQWIRASEGLLHGGFLARFLWIVSDKRERPLVALNDYDGEKDQARLREELWMFRCEGMPIQLSKDGRACYQQWYQDFISRYDGTAVESFASRMTMCALKVAGILQINADRSSQEIQGSSVLYAGALIDHLASNLRGFFETELEKSPDWFGKKVDQVLSLVRKRGEVPIRDLYRGLKISRFQMDQVIETVESAGQAVRARRGRQNILALVEDEPEVS